MGFFNREQAFETAQRIRKENAAIGPILAGRKAVEAQGITHKPDVERLGKEVADALITKAKETSPIPNAADEDHDAYVAKQYLRDAQEHEENLLKDIPEEDR